MTARVCPCARADDSFIDRRGIYACQVVLRIVTSYYSLHFVRSVVLDSKICPIKYIVVLHQKSR
jgi:hypothetical protein